jgi:transcriptional regulator with XRE-family HTH domain
MGARRVLDETQAEFAARMGTTQSLISRYEAGLVAPPAELLMHCVDILDSSFAANVTLEALVALVRERLRGAQMVGARTALAHLIQNLGAAPGAPKPRRSRERSGR